MEYSGKKIRTMSSTFRLCIFLISYSFVCRFLSNFTSFPCTSIPLIYGFFNKNQSTNSYIFRCFFASKITPLLLHNIPNQTCPFHLS
nr:MAG TPA: hypothetical protein [Caudoviricetes sp.]